MVPKNDLEKALTYTHFSPGGVEVSSQLEMDQKSSGYSGLLTQISPERIVELQLRLDEDIPYFQISSDESIGIYFARFGIPISSRADLELFSSALAQRIDSLDKKDEKVGSALEHLGYIRQLHQLPQALSKLEKSVSNFEQLSNPFKAVVEYVWTNVHKNKFRMKEEGISASEPYPANVEITPSQNSSVDVSIVIKGKEDRLDFYIHPVYKTKEVVKSEKGWFGTQKKIVVREKVGEPERLELIPIRIFDITWTKNAQIYNSSQYPKGHYVDQRVTQYLANDLDGKSMSDVIRFGADASLIVFSKTALTYPDAYMKSLQTYIEVILRLPSIMHNYAERTSGTLQKVLDSGLQEINGTH